MSGRSDAVIEGLSGRRALVTGAAGGIGSAVVSALIEADYRVVGTDLRTPIEEFSSATWIHADLVTESRSVVRAAADSLGGLDVLIHTAAIDEATPFLEISDEEWTRLIEVDLTTTFRLCQETALLMNARGAGRIILLGSIVSRQPWQASAHYASAKGGVDSLCRALAIEFAGRGIQVNAVLPGAIDTTMFRQLDASVASRTIERTPMGRIGSPEEIAHVVRWLCESPAYLTGQSLIVDGGYTINGTP